MLLQAAALTTLIATCAPSIAERDLVALVRNESGGDTLAIHDNTTASTYRPQDPQTAIARASQLLQANHSIDLGLMQINSKNLTMLGLTVESAFDGCSSVRAASDLLSRISAYNTGSPTRGFRNGYVARFVAARSSQPRPTGAGTVAQQQPQHEWHDAAGRQPQPEAAVIRRHQWYEASASIHLTQTEDSHEN